MFQYILSWSNIFHITISIPINAFVLDTFSSQKIEETNLIEKIKRNPSILEEKVEELVNNPSKFKQMLVKTIPQLIIDGLERISNNEETNDDKEEYEKDLPRKKRSLAGETVYSPEQRKCNSI